MSIVRIGDVTTGDVAEVMTGTPTSSDAGLVVKVASSGSPPTGTSATQVQGTAADGAAAVGNPVQVGGVDDSGNNQRFRLTSNGELYVGAITATPALADGASNSMRGWSDGASNTINFSSYQMVFNGTTWDRMRGDATNGLEVQGAGTAGTPAGGVVTIQGVSGGTGVGVTEAVTAAADVLAGHLAHTSTTAAATIITVAAGETWKGCITICCDVGIAAASSTAGQALGVVATAGTNVTPAAGTYLTCEARAGANAATGTVGSSGANSITLNDFILIAPVGNSVTLTGDTTIAGTAGRVSYSACGRYL